MVNVTDLDRKLSTLESRHHELVELMGQPETSSDPALLQKYGREFAGLNEVVGLYQQLQKTRAQIADTERMMEDGLDPELKEMAFEELDRAARSGRRTVAGASAGAATERHYG